jgi:hypothetical protein
MTQKLVKLFVHIGYNETDRRLLIDKIIYNQNIRSTATECYLGCIQGTKKTLTRHFWLKLVYDAILEDFSLSLHRQLYIQRVL